jgi:hypothetical protein
VISEAVRGEITQKHAGTPSVFRNEETPSLQAKASLCALFSSELYLKGGWEPYIALTLIKERVVISDPNTETEENTQARCCQAASTGFSLTVFRL